MSLSKHGDRWRRNAPNGPQGPASTGNYFLDVLLFFGGIAVALYLLCVLGFGALLGIGGFSILFSGFSQGFGGQLSAHLLQGALLGMLAGIATVIYRACRKNPSRVEDAFLSALFNEQGLQLQPGSAFWAQAAICGLIGFMAGALESASGAPGFLEAGSHLSGLSDLALVKILGGAGGAGGFDLLFLLLSVALALIVLGIAAGVIFGFGAQLLLFAAAGAAEGSTRQYIESVLMEAGNRDQTGAFRPLAAGALRGTAVGTVTGVLFALSTVINVWNSLP